VEYVQINHGFPLHFKKFVRWSVIRIVALIAAVMLWSATEQHLSGKQDSNLCEPWSFASPKNNLTLKVRLYLY